MDNKRKRLSAFCQFPIPTFEEWRHAVEQSLQHDESFDEKFTTRKYEGLVIQPLYRKKDVVNRLIAADIPGRYPFLRGTDAKKRDWLISQELTADTARELNQIAKDAFKKGQMVYHIAPDESMDLFSNLDDINIVFDQMNLTERPIHVNTGEISLPFLASLYLVAKKNGESPKELQGIIGADPLYEIVKTGTCECSLAKVYDSMATGIRWTMEKMPHIKTVLVHSHCYHDGGASAVDELACTLATGVEYVAELLKRGISPTDAGTSIAFSFSIGTDTFTEIAKLRSARLLWAAIMKEFGAAEQGQKLFIHARSSSFTKTKLDPYTNLLRATSEAYAAVVGGANSLHVDPYDIKLQKPSTFSQRIARNTQLILKEEAGLDMAIDPVGGSWYVENLTAEIAKKVWERFQLIEKEGGMSRALKKGIPQQWIEKTWQLKKTDVEKHRQIIIGVNRYPLDEDREVQENTKREKRKLTKNINVQTKLHTVEDMIKTLEQGSSFSQIYQQLCPTNRRWAVIPIPVRSWAQPFETFMGTKTSHNSKEGGVGDEKA